MRMIWATSETWTMKATLERDVLRQDLDYLALARIPARRNNTGCARFGKRLVRFGVEGLPDVLGLLPPAGRLLAVECKRPGGRLTDAQRAALANIAAAGFDAP